MKFQMGLALLLALGSAGARADIPTPTVDQLTVSGGEATELAKSLPGEYADAGTAGPFRMLRKTLRTPRGLTQIRCTRIEVSPGQVKSETCEMQKSGNPVPLPEER